MAGNMGETEVQVELPISGDVDGLHLSERTWKEVKLSVPWGHVSGKWWGRSGTQPIIAMHGWQDNAGTWDNLMPLLPHDIPVFCIDLPGHGLSSHYPTGQFYYVAWDGAMLVRRITKHYGWKKVTILGHSLGGIIGFMYSAMFPDSVHKLIQIDISHPPVRAPNTIVKMAANCIDKFLHYENLTEENMPCYEYEDMLDIVVDAYNGSVTRESCKVLLKRGIRPSPSGPGFLFARDVRLKVAGLSNISYEHVMELADSVRCRLLNIRALPYHSFDKASNYTDVLDKIRTNCQVEYHEVHGTHHLHLNTPQPVADIITKFLRS